MLLSLDDIDGGPEPEIRDNGGLTQDRFRVFLEFDYYGHAFSVLQTIVLVFDSLFSDGEPPDLFMPSLLCVARLTERSCATPWCNSLGKHPYC
jgi:hypothetical protein